MNETRSIKVLMTSYRRLKVLAAQTGETLLALVERLTVQEESRQAAIHSVVRSDTTIAEHEKQS